MFYTNVVQWGNTLLIREVDGDVRRNHRVKYSPTLYVPAKAKTEFFDLNKNNVAPVSFETIKEAKEFISNYSQQSNLVHGLDKFNYTWISENYPKAINWDSEKILLFTIDIEVECENGFPDPEKAQESILVITLKNHQTNIIHVFGRGNFKTNRPDVKYHNARNEQELILNFMDYWEKNYPDVITGWNVDQFDITYICSRIKNLFGEKVLNKLSPWSNVYGKKKKIQGHENLYYDLQGISCLDYLRLYKKFTYKNQESYTLGHIGEVEVGEAKNNNPYSSFKEWYTQDYQSFVEYNIQDVELVDKIDDKLKLIDLAYTMAYEAKINFADVFSPVRMWDVIIHNFLIKNKVVIPQVQENYKNVAFEGAYVKHPITGIHDWVVSFDLNSLYPHLIMQYNISPETLVDANLSFGQNAVNDLLDRKNDLSFLKNKNITICPNGATYTTEYRGFLPQLMEMMYNDRVTFKKKMIESKKKYEETKDKKYLKEVSRYDNIQMAKKIALNSAYGAVGNQGFRYFKVKNAEAITTSGQLAIRWVEKSINEYMNKLLGTNNKDYVIASDTDSIYISFSDLVKKVVGTQKLSTEKIIDYLDKVTSERFQEVIDKSYEELAEYLNAYDQKMIMKREVIADKGIWTAKKRYILNVWDSEGVRYKEPKLKIMGIEAVKSSTPAACREKIIEGIKIILNKDEDGLNKFIRQFRQEFFELPLDKISFPRGVNGLEDWHDSSSIYKTRTPIHVKGSLLYNFFLRSKKLTDKYPLITSGDKIKFVYLRTPNFINSNVISFKVELPKSLDIDKFIDRELQFVKAFIEPFILIADKVNMKIDRGYGENATLEDLFT